MRSGEQRVTIFHLRPLRTDELLAKQPRAANATHGFLRSLTRGDLAESRLGAVTARSTDAPDPRPERRPNAGAAR